MDRLFHIAQRGSVEELHQLLAENSNILHQVPLISSENPLHVSSAIGHLDFAKELLKLKPDYASQLNAEGYSPMHIASANGHIDVVKEIIKVNPELCRVEGREGTTPLHLAVLSGRVDVISELLANCEGCLEDLTVQKESVLHLAVRNFQFGSLQVLLDWIILMKKEEFLNSKDEHENTVLHLATWKKQRQVLELLVEKGIETLDINEMNNSGLTAMDLLYIFPSEAGDREICDILQGAGALKAQELTIQNNTTAQSFFTHQGPPQNTIDYSKDLLDCFRFHEGRDSPSDVRTTLLIIAVLVATATYQVGMNPPGNFWQDDDKGHVAGTSIMGFHDLTSYIILVTSNSIGFNISLFIISALTDKFPLQIEIQICLLALYMTFNTTAVATSPNSSKIFNQALTTALSATTPWICMLLRKYRVYQLIGRIFCKLLPHRAS